MAGSSIASASRAAPQGTACMRLLVGQASRLSYEDTAPRRGPSIIRPGGSGFSRLVHPGSLRLRIALMPRVIWPLRYGQPCESTLRNEDNPIAILVGLAASV